MTKRDRDFLLGVGLVVAAILVAMLVSMRHARGEPLPVPRSAGSCPHGFFSSGSHCVPRAGAQDAVSLPPGGSCPWGWTRSGDYCLRSGRTR